MTRYVPRCGWRAMPSCNLAEEYSKQESEEAILTVPRVAKRYHLVSPVLKSHHTGTEVQFATTHVFNQQAEEPTILINIT